MNDMWPHEAAFRGDAGEGKPDVSLAPTFHGEQLAARSDRDSAERLVFEVEPGRNDRVVECNRNVQASSKT